MRVCLIVDSPLRDLDGLILVAWQLAMKGIESYLIPMYMQDFDVFSIDPDLVLVNYARPNNIEQLIRFYNKGISIAVLDTEGAPHMQFDDFAKNIKKIGVNDIVSLYFIWGQEQYSAFSRQNSIHKDALHLVGCPRYDYCTNPLRGSTFPKGINQSYILINTRFSAINPRFTSGSHVEKYTMIRAGFNVDWVEKFINDSEVSYNHFVQSIKQLSLSFPDEEFILRPHPFEDCMAYSQLNKLKNIRVIQDGTSIDWISSAKLLIHQNCLTSNEAVMMNIEPISLEWFNTDSIREEGACNISRSVQSQKELESLVEAILSDKDNGLDSQILKTRTQLIQNRFYKVDGKSAKRVADLIYKEVTADGKVKKKIYLKFNLRQNALFFAKKLFGFKLYHSLKSMVQGGKYDKKIAGKSFNLKQVEVVLKRINNALGNNESIKACYADDHDMKFPKYASNQVIKIFQTKKP
jgi:surface carbohydrate biosynthesis protein